VGIAAADQIVAKGRMSLARAAIAAPFDRARAATMCLRPSSL